MSNLYIASRQPCRPILIADDQNNDVCEIFADDYATTTFSRVEAERLASMIVTAEDLAATLEAFTDLVASDRELRRQYSTMIDAAERVLRRAYGAK